MGCSACLCNQLGMGMPMYISKWKSQFNVINEVILLNLVDFFISYLNLWLYAVSTYHEMELPISSMNCLIKGTGLDAELFNKWAMLQWLITKLLKGRNPAVFYSVLNLQLVPMMANTILENIIHFRKDWRKCFNVSTNHSLRPISYWPAIRLQNIQTAVSFLSVLSISGLQVHPLKGDSIIMLILLMRWKMHGEK